MEKTDHFADLKERIVLLEELQQTNKTELRQSFRNTVDSIRPFNLIKETIKDATESGPLKDNLINTAIGVSAGYLSKKIVTGGSKNIFTRLLGTIVMFGVTNLVSKNAETLKKLGADFMHFPGTQNDSETGKE